MLLLISVNLYSFSGVHNRPPNWLQEIFNTVFPFLKMIEVRETFSAFFLLYLCMLLCFGLKMFFNEEEFRSLTDRNHRSLLWVMLGLIAFKAVVMFHVCRCFLYNSTIDLLAIITIAGFALFVFLYNKREIRLKVFWAMALLVTIAELYNYNVSLRDNVLQNNWLSPMITENEKTRDKGFVLSRYLFVDFSGLPLAFSEPIFKVKGAFSRGNNHHLFTTKRYYDYMTHVPIESQFLLSGMTASIFRFFPEGKTVILKDRREVLSYLSIAPAYALSDTLALERGSVPENTRGADGTFAGLDKYEDMPSLEKNNINLAHAGFARNTGVHLTNLDIYNYMNTGEFSLKVESFSPNSLTVNVKNSVNGYLYYNDGWSKYWRAFDNGVETEVKPANYAFKAVFLKSGTHTVTFAYRPIAYLISLYAYFAALSVTVIVIAVFSYRNRDILTDKTTD
ncbi:hypothetical protein EPN18_09165 [bacterium]|nr:MAG: hypothetical protein EPN18_09165 [bacterium]